MSAGTMISLAEYLATHYDPDCDYVDGQVEERNVGEWSHSELQLQIGSYLLQQYRKSGIRVVTELRIRVTSDRVRIPDVCVYLSDLGERVPTQPPFICIEILSPEDRMSHLEVRINDYLSMGVSYVWILDPETKQVYTATLADGLREVKSGILITQDPVIEVSLAQIMS